MQNVPLYVRRATEESALLPCHIAYLDFGFEHGKSAIVTGPYEKKLLLSRAAEELARKHSPTKQVNSPTILRWMRRSEWSGYFFREGDYVCTNLDRGGACMREFFETVYSHRVRGIGRLCSDGFVDAIKRLDLNGVARHFINGVDMWLSYEDGKLRVSEIMGVEPETDELIFNTVYSGEVYSGHSFLFERVLARNSATLPEELGGRAKKVMAVAPDFWF